MIGDERVRSLLVSRDTPHARVSVSYVLEASLLNDRFQNGVGGETLVGSELHARFLVAAQV
jgi:hypothetical protein